MYGEAVPCEGDHLAQLSLQEVDSLAAGQSTEGGALPGQRDGFAALGIELEPLGKIEGRAVLLYHVERMNEESANALLKVMEEPPEGVLFLLTADSLAGVLPTIRSRCVSFAVAPVSPEQCARYCAAQGVDKKTAALYSELFDGHIGTVLAAAQDEARTAQVEKALQLAKAAADRDSYAAACLLAAYEKDKAGAAALLTDFRAVAAAGLRQSPHAPVQGIAAQRALRLAEAAIQRLGAQVNPKIVLSVFAAKFRAL